MDITQSSSYCIVCMTKPRLGLDALVLDIILGYPKTEKKIRKILKEAQPKKIQPVANLHELA